jgi:hypothetical protein
VQLQEKSKARKQSGTFLIEGKREIELAIQGSYELETILFFPDLINAQQVNRITKVPDCLRAFDFSCNCTSDLINGFWMEVISFKLVKF